MDLKTNDVDQILSKIKEGSIPSHVAIVMDGNRRWASTKNLPIAMGHWEGAETLSEIVEAAIEIGVKTLTVYAFSTENWSRSYEEVESLMSLFEIYLKQKTQSLINEGIRLRHIGDLSPLPTKLIQELSIAEESTKLGKNLNLVIAINYGGRDEIRRAISKIIQIEGITPNDITEELITKHLDTAEINDPDLIIRTSGELRLSNFMLWQASYSEIYSTAVLWPDFKSKEFQKAILDYQQRSRRRGG
jgi:undecaprenyl diphosphate synthase